MRDRLDRYQSVRIDVCNTRADFARAVVPIFAEVVSIFAELVLVLQHLCRVFAIVGREKSVVFIHPSVPLGEIEWTGHVSVSVGEKCLHQVSNWDGR